MSTRNPGIRVRHRGCPAFSTQSLTLRLLLFVLLGLVPCIANAQTPLPSPSPAPTPITKTGSILVNNASTVGRISKWVTSSNNGTGIIGDSAIIESSIGTIGIGTNPFSDFKLGVDGNTSGALFGRSAGNNVFAIYGLSTALNGTGVRGNASSSTSGTGVSGFGTLGVYGETQGNNPSGDNVGVKGYADHANSMAIRGIGIGGALAGRFDGDVVINGNLSVSGAANLTANEASHATTADNAVNASNANTVTNGVYTTGSYTNPAWIVVLAGSKITGAVANATNAVNATTASTVSVPLNLSNSGNVITATSTGGNAIEAHSNSSTGNALSVVNDSNGVAVYGSSQGGFAGFFQGDVNVNGNLTTTSINAANLSAPGTVNAAANPIDWGQLKDVPPTIAAGVVVNSINGITSDVTLAAGDNVTITSTGHTLTISSSPSPKLNPQQLALLRWYDLNKTDITVNVGPQPRGATYDGAYVWTANYGSNTVSKIRASDGEVVGTFAVGNQPFFIAYDGENIWTSNESDNTVTKVRARDGVKQFDVNVGVRPTGIAFDGQYTWVANNREDSVTKIRAKDGQIIGSYNVGNDPYGIAFDGTNIWVACANDGAPGYVTKLNPNDGHIIGQYVAGNAANGIVFDGENIWVSSFDSGNVQKYKASDGTLLATIPIGAGGAGIIFDGVYVWALANTSGTLTKIKASSNQVIGTFPIGSQPNNIAFDGANIWVTLGGSGQITKR